MSGPSSRQDANANKSGAQAKRNQYPKTDGAKLTVARFIIAGEGFASGSIKLLDCSAFSAFQNGSKTLIGRASRIFVAAARQMASYVCMKMVFSILVGLLFVSHAFAAATNTPASAKYKTSVPVKIGALEATNHYDETMIVTGRVVQVTVRPSVTFLNLDKPFPNSPFAIVIIHGKSSYYGDANALKGKSIEISGKIRNFKDKPEIVLASTNQLTVLNFTNSVKTPAAPAMPPPTQTPSTGSATNDFPEIM